MVLVIATAGLVYELVIAAVASYVLGDSVTQFSTIIGVYLSALGLGAYLSRFVVRRLALTFIDVELAAALIGGLSAPLLFLAFNHTAAFRPIMYSQVVLVGTLVGLELPLLIRLLERQVEFKELIARALTFDYAGALVGSLAFSLLLVPRLGLVHTSLLCGLLNAGVGLASTWLLPGADEREQRGLAGARIRAVVVVLMLLALFTQGERITQLSERGVFAGKVVVAEQSRYQRIVITERGPTLQLFLNGNLQFDSADEHRYHEALVHPAMATAAQHRKIAIGGGGDGLAAREVFKWPGVERVALVDLDPRITQLALDDERLARLNRSSLSDPRMEVVNEDAMLWFRESDETFDVVLLDFPDPSNYSLGKLYSARFYETVHAHLNDGGALVIQSTSPLFARGAFWCVVNTVEAAGFHTRPFHAFIPSFGEWGYVLAKKKPFEAPTELPVVVSAKTRFLTSEVLSTLFHFPADMSRIDTEVNRLNNQALVTEYTRAWARWN